MRELADNCKVNIRYMYLINWERPSYRTFGYFIKEVLAEKIGETFRDINEAIFQAEHVDLGNKKSDSPNYLDNENNTNTLR